MTDAIAGGVTRVSTRWFYVWMSATCFAIAVLGFMPTYFAPIVQGKLDVPPIVHLHGLILFAWVTFFFVQTWLVARGTTLAHRTWGLLGVALATAIVFIVVAVVSMRIAQASLPGQPDGLARDVKAFAWVSIGGLLFFVPVFVLAIANIKRSETHKRLMLLGTISFLGAPIARWFLTFLAPPPDPNALPLPEGLPVIAVPPVFVAIAPALVGDLLWVAAMIFDWRTRGSVHPVYLIGGGIMLLLQISVVQVASSDLWQSVATAIGHLAG